MKPEQDFLLLSAGVLPVEVMQVLQSPAELLLPPNKEDNLTCTHKVPNGNTILWYQRSKGDTALKLMGYIYYGMVTVEPPFKDDFDMSGDGRNTAYLHILNPKPEHSAEYFGAATRHSDKNSLSLLQKP